jgi:hypothetical protein
MTIVEQGRSAAHTEFRACLTTVIPTGSAARADSAIRPLFGDRIQEVEQGGGLRG